MFIAIVSSFTVWLALQIFSLIEAGFDDAKNFHRKESSRTSRFEQAGQSWLQFGQTMMGKDILLKKACGSNRPPNDEAIGRSHNMW